MHAPNTNFTVQPISTHSLSLVVLLSQKESMHIVVLLEHCKKSGAPLKEDFCKCEVFPADLLVLFWLGISIEKQTI